MCPILSYQNIATLTPVYLFSFSFNKSLKFGGGGGVDVAVEPHEAPLIN